MTSHAYRFFCGLAVWSMLVSAAAAGDVFELNNVSGIPMFTVSVPPVDPQGPVNSDFLRGACWVGYTASPQGKGRVIFNLPDGKQYYCPAPRYREFPDEQPKKGD